ncbi:lamin tail domain-containing protein, partial [bacterium]|nr:lamin tail domain-containing protein [bacterium]
MSVFLSQFSSVYKYALIFGLCFFIAVPVGNAQIQINELLTSTDQTTPDGTPLEWIELRNAGDAAVDLTGYSLSDELLIPYKWLLPSVTLQPNAFLLIYTTGLNQYGQDEYHANFRLDKDGETISLTAPNGVLEDRVSYPDQKTDVSYGRDPSTSSLWRFLSPPTPGQTNSSNGYLGFAKSDASSVTAGRYDNPVTVQLIPYHQEAEIRYTLDGTEPDESSALYNAPISMNQTSLIRSRTFREGYLPSKITTRTYIIRENINRPIISLTTDPDNLWDRRTGIYANATASGDAWERPVHIE